MNQLHYLRKFLFNFSFLKSFNLKSTNRRNEEENGNAFGVTKENIPLIDKTKTSITLEIKENYDKIFCLTLYWFRTLFTLKNAGHKKKLYFPKYISRN